MRGLDLRQYKNYALAALVLFYYFLGKAFSLPLLSVSQDQTVDFPKDISVYIQKNLLFVGSFLLLLTVSFTLFLLSYLIYAKFDRNRAASLTGVRAGFFFLCAAFAVITGSTALDVFSTHAHTFDYIFCACLLFLPVLFIRYTTTLYFKKIMLVFDWVFTAAFAAVFVINLFAAPAVVSLYIKIYHFLTLILLAFCSFLHTKDLLAKLTASKPFYIIFGFLELAGLLSAAVFAVIGMNFMYWICICLSLVATAYLILSELVNMAARQYAKTADDEKIRRMAYTDALCGTGNRNAFLAEQNETYDSDSLYYVVFDVNNLKGINDTYGHSEGDMIIKKAAELIMLCFNPIGNCFRIGGDEFAVIGRYKTEDELNAVLDKLRSEIDNFNRGSVTKLSLAYGCAVRNNTETNTYELFNKADKAMYRCKRRAKS